MRGAGNSERAYGIGVGADGEGYAQGGVAEDVRCPLARAEGGVAFGHCCCAQAFGAVAAVPVLRV